MVIDLNPEHIIRRAKPLTDLVVISLILVILLEFGLSSVITSSIEAKHSLASYLDLLAPIMLGLLGLEVALIVLSIQLARMGGRIYSRPAAIIGCGFIIGGVWFDVLATIMHSPDLCGEGNPFIRLSQQLHAPLLDMYLLGFFAQLGITVISCAFWIAALRHADTYLHLLWKMGPRSLIQFFWTAIGGNLKPNKLQSEGKPFPRSYRAVWFIVILLIDPTPRYIVGVEWFGFSIPRILEGFVGYALAELLIQAVSIGLGIYALWLLYSYFRGRPSSMRPTIETHSESEVG